MRVQEFIRKGHRELLVPRALSDADRHAPACRRAEAGDRGLTERACAKVMTCSTTRPSSTRSLRRRFEGRACGLDRH